MLIKKRLDDLPWFHFILPLAFFLAGISIIVFYSRFEFDTDEGINLIKAFLVGRDYQLYQEISSDQPPLLTNLLAFLFDIFEQNVDLARGLILVFSTILLWQVWLILYLLGGVVHAYIGCLFLLISPHYWRLSISVMIGLPCITLALGSVISIIIWQIDRKNIWLIISALLLCLSAATKIFTLFLAPIIVLGMAIDLVLNRHQYSWIEKLKQPALWLTVFAIFGSIVFLFQVGIDNIHFLIGSHASARDIDVFQRNDLGGVIKNDYRIFLLGFTVWGTIIAVRQRQWQILYFTAWSIAAYSLLINHRPVWYHHILLLLVPTLVMVGYSLGEIITTGIRSKNSYLRFKKHKILTLFTLAVFFATILLIGEQVKTTAAEIDDLLVLNNDVEIASHINRQFLAEIIKLKPQTDWIVTDSPMFAFRAGIPIPPSTAVLSLKQVTTGNATEQELLDVINVYQPQQILFKRFPWKELTDSIQSDYQLQKQERNYRLYVRAENEK